MKQANQGSIPLTVPITTMDHFRGLDLPTYQTRASAGMDLRAAVSETLYLDPMQRSLVPTGLKIAIPMGFEGQIRPRSGLAVRMGLGMVNAPGTIDADYRGEIKVPLINLGQQVIGIERGMRIAQLIIAPVVQIQWLPTPDLPESGRGDGGFGHTGVG